MTLHDLSSAIAAIKHHPLTETNIDDIKVTPRGVVLEMDSVELTEAQEECRELNKSIFDMEGDVVELEREIIMLKRKNTELVSALETVQQNMGPELRGKPKAREIMRKAIAQA